MNILREFGVRLGLDFDPKKVEAAKKRMEELGESMRDLGLHAGEAAAALLGLAEITGIHAHNLENESKQLGISTDKLQELEFAAKTVAQVSRGELVGALGGLSNTLFEARTNNDDAIKTFVQLGVSIQDLQDPTLTSDKLMAKLADRFAQMPDGMYKTALANKVGGATFEKLLPLLSKGSKGLAQYGKEAHTLGVVLSGDAIRNGAKFEEQFQKVWFIIKNLSFTIGNELIKYLYPIVIQFQQWVVANKKFIATGIATVMKALGLYLGIIFRVTKFVADRFVYLTKVVGGLERVSKLLAIAMGIITGFKIISGIGILLTSLKAVAVVMAGISWEAIAIGAAFIALILIFQDLFSDDSVIKEWGGKLIGFFANLFTEMKAHVAEFVDYISGAFQSVLASIGTVTGAFKGAGSFFGSGFDKVKSLFGGTATPSATSANSAAAVANQNNSSTQQTANITVQVPPGTSASAATAIVSGGVQDGFSAVLRKTRNQALGGVAY
jgi:hypothetical protein